ncbi:MAG: alpha-amylase family glycosyl hydrolase [Candidatus Riflebacteria bacterium]|nr:alpha-amylase family glycosyl hydrolase [Candidatus Riflebacteria bacterium]
MNNWINEAVFYHIYPLGAFAAPRNNDYFSPPVERLAALGNMVEHFLRLGINAVYLGPVFESDAHGYDTSSFFHVDRRLGENATLKAAVRTMHEHGIRVILDGVFNHVGRNFWAFRDLQMNGQSSSYLDWFEGIDFSRCSPYGDRFHYDCWNGNHDLVKLNLANNAVLEHILSAVEMWIKEFAIDGLRLDVADCLSFDFMRSLSGFCKRLRSDFWLMGEVVHGDYRKWVADGILDSVTNYECYKGLHSSHFDKNYFEIAWSLNRQFGENGIYKGLQLYNFVDNHDVSRIIDVLARPEHLYTVYCLLFTMPGVPSIYYGSEFGIGGKKNKVDDWPLRPSFDWREQQDKSNYRDLAAAIARLSFLRRGSPALCHGTYRQLYINHEQICFLRQTGDERVVVMVNASDKPWRFQVEIPFETGAEGYDLLNEQTIAVGSQQIICEVSPNWARVLRV